MLRKFVVLFRIWRAWGHFPQLRLGQLIANALPYHRTPMFYISDDELSTLLQKFVDDWDTE